MKKILTSMALAGVLAFTLGACTAETESGDTPEGDTPADTETGCACDSGKAGEDVWCADCGHGFMGGEKVTDCKGCFDVKKGDATECADCAAKETEKK